MVTSTWPDTFAVIEPTRDPVRITFSERISERPTEGTLESAVIVSPSTGETRVDHTRSGLEIEVLGGFKPDLVYRVRVLPTVKDLFNNTMEGPFELVFSTGAPFQANVVAGMVRDRISGERVRGARVEAREEDLEDPPVYVATTDSAGVFALRYLPSGSYRLTLFEDINRNQEANFAEAQGSAEIPALGAGGEGPDTAIVREVRLLRPDTTPARLIRAEAVDSLTVRMAFDDYLDAEETLDPVQLRVAREGEDPVDVEALLWPRQQDSLQAVADSIAREEQRLAVLDSLRTVADSLGQLVAAMEAAGDTLGVDTLSVALESIEAQLEPPEPEEREEEPGPEAETPSEAPVILPKQEIFARLSEPLAPNELYEVVVSGVVNLNGLGGGGGESSITWEPPEPPPEAEADTAGTVLPDTVAPPDTGVVVLPDTVAPPDTGVVVLPDTLTPPDTGVVVLPVAADRGRRWGGRTP
jgi:hypothetical protein